MSRILAAVTLALAVGVLPASALADEGKAQHDHAGHAMNCSCAQDKGSGDSAPRASADTKEDAQHEAFVKQAWAPLP